MCGIEPLHGSVDGAVQQLLKHLARSLESGSAFYDKRQNRDQPATNSDGCEDPDVEDGVFVCRGKLEVLNNEFHAGVCECVMAGGWVRGIGGGQGWS